MQSNVREADLAYLAGLWDGEGTFGMQSKLNTASKVAYSAYVSIANTNRKLIVRVQDILSAMKIKTTVRDRQRGNNSKVITEIAISKSEGKKLLIESLIPFVIGKQNVANVILEFLKRRDEVEKTQICERSELGRITKGKKLYTFSDVDTGIYKQVQELNKRGSNKFDYEPEPKTIEIGEIDLAYLAGVYDAEGCFTVARVNDNFRLMCTLTNCDPVLIGRVISILSTLGINFSQSKGHRNNRQPYYSVGIYRLVDGKKLIETLQPYLVGKSDVARLVLAYIDSRLSKVDLTRKHRSVPYTNEELEIQRKIRLLNQRGLRLPVEQSAEKQSRELLETPNSEMRRTISSEVPLNKHLISGKRSTTMATASRAKRLEARDSFIKDEDIV